MNTPNRKLIDEARQRAEDATPGPWEFNISTLMEAALWIENWDGRLWLRADKGTNVKSWDMSENAKFIAHARTDIPALCDALESAEGEIERLKEALSYLPKAPTQPYEKELASELARYKLALEYYANGNHIREYYSDQQVILELEETGESNTARRALTGEKAHE